MITKPLGVTASARGGLDDCIRPGKKKYITFFLLFFFYSCRPDVDDNDSDHDIDELTRILNVFDTDHRRPRREAPIQKAICARSYLGLVRCLHHLISGTSDWHTGWCQYSTTRLFIPLRATIDTDIS